MRNWRPLLAGSLLALVLAVSTWRVGLTQGQQCGGSFTPQLNCIVSGLWNYTNTAGPFQVNGITASGVVSATTTLSNAQVLALHNTPVLLLAAPGTGKYLDVISVSAAFKYTATYTNGGNLRVYWGGPSVGNAASGIITASGFLTSVSASSILRVAGVPDGEVAPTTSLGLYLGSISGVAFGGGNAANTLTIVVNYRVVTSGLSS